MKLLVIATALLLPASASPEPAQAPQPEGAAAVRHMPTPPMPDSMSRMPNVYTPGGANCLPIVQQVDAEKRRLNRADAHTLDREPVAFGFLAVDRNVGGCREVTFLRGRREPVSGQAEPAR